MAVICDSSSIVILSIVSEGRNMRKTHPQLRATPTVNIAIPTFFKTDFTPFLLAQTLTFNRFEYTTSSFPYVLSFCLKHSHLLSTFEFSSYEAPPVRRFLWILYNYF